MAALTFVLGALAAWMPTFLVRVHGLSMGAAGSAFGLLTVLTGVVGTMAGGMLGDRALRGHPAGYLWVSAAGLFLAVPATWIAIRVDVPVLFWTFAAIAETLVFLNTGPLNAVIVSVADANTRAMAVGANVLFIHLFGDALSPWLVGTLSDRFGIRSALEVMAPALLLSGLLCVVAGRVLTASASARSSDGG
jgi:sugar phosphate permease